MEHTTSRNSIILKNINSPYIEQAIFILKTGNDADEFSNDIVKEAQKIVDEFIRRKRKKKLLHGRIRKTLQGISIAFIMITAVLLIFYIL